MISDTHNWLADSRPARGVMIWAWMRMNTRFRRSEPVRTSMTIRMYANHKKLALDDVLVEIKHSRQHGEDCLHCDEDNTYIELFERRVTLKGDLAEHEKQRLLSQLR
jgi:hypothetical protein